MARLITRVSPQWVTSFPTPMRPGILYVSTEYNSCGHLCACGCNNEVITPLSPAHWRLTYDGETISLAPSIGNGSLACNSHYWIHRNEVEWSRPLTPSEFSRAHLRDRRTLEECVEAQSAASAGHRFLQALMRRVARRG